MPYISASIIFQLLGAIVPSIQRMQQQGEEGRKKITQWTRYSTMAISAMQAFGVAVFSGKSAVEWRAESCFEPRHGF